MSQESRCTAATAAIEESDTPPQPPDDSEDDRVEGGTVKHFSPPVVVPQAKRSGGLKHGIDWKENQHHRHMDISNL
jgi:hypothetical protein